MKKLKGIVLKARQNMTRFFIYTGIMSVTVLASTEYIGAEESAADKIKNAIVSGITSLVGVLKAVGGAISGLITIITGIGVIIILIMMIVDVTRNNGQNDVWGNHSTKFFWLMGIATVAGLITAAFFLG
ncbi:hypothetical protein [Breznakia pachnodae]|uniref:Membrane protein n=1 Tax=Breznakia pachnodae TaxID=265178 RepID=A0ABU0E6K2_9FIRM|nr:hypothetical protein [Breznakia pachnodae]MDQ0362537.1 putative membrane protein [Breznakia pachnodae]